MTTPTVPVTVKLTAMDGTPYEGVVVTAKLDQNDRYQGFVISDSVSATTDATGTAVLNLFPNHPTTGLGTTGSVYRVTAHPPGGKRLDVTAQVPNAACMLDAIADLEVVPPLTQAQAAQASASASAASASASAIAGAASAAEATTQAGNAATSAAEATTQAGDAATSAGVATTQAGNAATSASAAAASRTAIDNRIYPGAYAADPVTRPDGSAVQAGDEYFNNVANLNKRYNGATWIASDLNPAVLAASGGSALVGWKRTAVASVAHTIGQWLDGTPINVFEFMTDAEVEAVQAGAYALDVTTAMQAAFTAAGIRRCRKVIAPAGGYLLSAALLASYGMELYGEGFEFTRFYRTGNYGDTIQWGTAIAAGGPGRCSGIWFMHSAAYTPGDITLADKATTGAHLRFYGCQRPIVEDCWMWRLPYQIVFEGGSVITVRNCNLYGVYDHTLVAAQEGIAQLYLKKNATFGSPTTVRLENVKWNGTNSGARNVTLTSSDGSVVKSIAEQVGSQFGLFCDGGEDIEIAGGYAGGHNYQSFLFQPSTTSIIDVRIHDVHFDGARDAQLAFASSGAADTLGAQIHDNTFNGELVSGNAISVVGSAAVLTNFTITGNTSFQHFRSGFNIMAARGGVISGNTISSYNTLNAASTDLQWVTGINVDNSFTHDIEISDNTVGGGGNAFDASTGNTFTYKGIEIGATCVNVSAHDNKFAAIRDGANFRYGAAQTPNQYVQTVAGNYTMSASDDIYIRKYVASVLNGIFLPLRPMTGREVVVKDGQGDAGTYNISIGTGDATTIDGAATQAISTNYGYMRFRFNGTQWNRVG